MDAKDRTVGDPVTAMVMVSLVAGAAGVIIQPWRLRPRRLDASTATSRSGFVGSPVVGGPVWGAAVVLAGLVWMPLGLAVLAAPAIRAQWRRKQRPALENRAAVRGLPEAIDLLRIGVGAGLSARQSLVVCRSWFPAPYDVAFGDVLRRAEAGEPLAVAFDAAAVVLGEPAQPLLASLRTAESAGGGIAARLGLLGESAHRQRRTAASTRAQRLPVVMLGPLLLCVLPAFLLIAVAPLLLASISEFDLRGIRS